MSYSKDMSKFWRSGLIALIIFQVLIAVLVGLRMFFFAQNNPYSLLGASKFLRVFILKLVFNILDLWGEVMFWLLFLLSMYLWIGYKMGSGAAVLLPPYD